MELYEKLAAAKSAGLLGTAARGAWNVGKGVIAPFSGTSATSSLGQKALHGMASAYTVGQPMAASLAPAASPPATANIAGRSFGNGQRDNGTVHTAQWKVAAVKAAFGLQNPKDLLDMGSYAAMIGSKLLPHDNPWHTRLEAAGLLGLGGSVGADIEPSHGARFRIVLNKREFFLHHPHHSNEFSKQEVKHLRECLASAGVTLSSYDEMRASAAE